MTPEQKQKADKLEAAGLKASDIAKEIGVNPQNVYDYQHRKRVQKMIDNGITQEEQKKPEPKSNKAEEDTKKLIVKLIQDMLDVLKKLYGI